MNQVRFDGTVRRVSRETVEGTTLETVRQVTLEPGTYVLELTSRAGKRKLARTLVTIVDPKFPGKQSARPRCSLRGPVPVLRPTDGVLRHEDGSVASVQSISPSAAADSSSGAAEPDFSQVLGDPSPEAGGVPLAVPASETDGRGLFESVLPALALIAAIALAIAVFASLRRRRRPAT